MNSIKSQVETTYTVVTDFDHLSGYGIHFSLESACDLARELSLSNPYAAVVPTSELGEHPTRLIVYQGGEDCTEQVITYMPWHTYRLA
jgi:hypothetical protein